MVFGLSMFVVDEEKASSHNNNILAYVKSAEATTVTFTPNSEITIKGYLQKKEPYHQVSALLQFTPKSKIHSDLDISPAVLTIVIAV